MYNLCILNAASLIIRPPSSLVIFLYLFIDTPCIAMNNYLHLIHQKTKPKARFSLEIKASPNDLEAS